MDVDGRSGASVVRVGGWEGYGWLRAGFSARCGGVSSAYGGKTLNLGWKSEDDDANVAENRRRILRGVAGEDRGGGGFRLVTVRQIHSDGICVVREGDGPLVTENGRAVLEGDGLVTDVPGVMLGVQVADCVPVLVADVERRVVGAFHAGWRGTLAGIAGLGVERMREEFGSRAEDLVAAVGPSIGPCCYSVGAEVRELFEGRFGYGAGLFSERVDEEGRAATYLDLWEANRRQLADAGVAPGKIEVLGECSACARDEAGERRYFSHRAENGAAGRMMAAIGVARDGIRGQTS